MPAPLVPVLVAAGITALATFMAGRKRKKAGKEGYGQAKANADSALASNDLTYIGQVANWLRDRGFPELAASVQAHWQAIKDGAETAADPRSRPGYGQAKAYRDTYLATIHDPAQLRALATWERDNGFPEFAAELEAAAAAIDAHTAPTGAVPPGGGVVSPGVAPGSATTTTAPAPDSPPVGPVPSATPTPDVAVDWEGPAEGTPDDVPPPPPVEATPPVASEETSEEADPDGTVALARLLFAREATAGWKEDNQPQVKVWQGIVGLGADGKFGPGSAYRMAEEVGVLPLIRFWPKSEWNKAAAVDKYRASIRQIAERFAESNPAHAAALRASATRETGQSWPTSTTSTKPIEAMSLDELNAYNAEVEAELRAAGLDV